MTTTTIALDLPTWTGPAWATEHDESADGIRWVRRATTVVTEDPDPGAPREPISMEVVGYDFLQVVGAAAGVERAPVQVLVGGRELSLDGARNLIAALTELVEAVEEGMR